MPFGQPIEFRDFAPDADTRVPGVIVDCDGLMATTRGYATMPSAVKTGAVIPNQEVVRGAYATRMPNGYPLIFAGTDSHLYRLINGVWTSWYAGALSTADHWSFATYGNIVLAVNGSDQPLISEDGNAFVPLAAPITPSTGEPPVSCCVEALPAGVFLVEQESNRWWYAANPKDWTLDIAYSVVSAPIASAPGNILSVYQLTSGAAVFFKDTSMHLAQYIGPPFFWAVNPVSQQVGCPSPLGVVTIRDAHFFIGPDDFYQFDGSSLRRIPNNLKEWFFKRADPNYLNTVIGNFDPINSIAFWHYAPRGVTPPGLITEWVSYNLRSQKWARGSLVIEAAVQPYYLNTGREMTYDEFGEAFPPNTPDGSPYDNIPVNTSYDSPLFSADVVPASGYFDTDHELMTMTGEPAGGYLVTGEIGDGASFWQLQAVRPVFSKYPSNRLARLDAFKRPTYGWPVPDNDPFPRWPTTGPVATLNRDGAIHLIQVARSHQLKLSLTSAAEIVGMQYDLVRVGTQ